MVQLHSSSFPQKRDDPPQRGIMLSPLFLALEERFDSIDECRDVAQHGCEMGVNGFIYYWETKKFFNEHQVEIEAYLDGIYGESLLEDLSKNNGTIDQIINEMVWIVVRDHCSCVAGKADELQAV